MKKFFIVLSFFMILTFTIFNNNKASASDAIDFGGTNMVFKTLYLYDIANPDFEFTGNWWENEVRGTFIFEHAPIEESLGTLMQAWSDVIVNFMEVYTQASGTFPYLANTNSSLIGNIGWHADDGYLYIIVKETYFQEYYPNDTPVQAMGELAEVIRVNSWVITESTPDYQLGYNTGYNNGYSKGREAGFSNGWHAKEEQVNLELPILLADEYQRGLSDGYDEGVLVSQGEAYELGYKAGANESFIGTMDKWLVPAIIIVMLLGGYFAIARKKRDGDI